MKNASPSTLRAELWDNMHYLFRDVNDRMVHASFTYGFRIDPDVLLSACSLGDDLTLGMCIRGNAGDRVIVERFFDVFIRNTRLLLEDIERTAF